MSFAVMARPRSLDHVADAPPWWRRIDMVLVGSALAIALSGLLMVYSATRSGHGEGTYLGLALRQATWFVVGIVTMTVVASIDYRKLRPWTVWLYGAAVLVLIAALTPLGSKSKGAQAWFQLAGFQLQPSEFSKVVLVMALAAYCARQRRGMQSRHVATACGITGLMVVPILLQPDLGTALVYGAITLAAVVIAGASGRAILALVAAVVLVAAAAVSFGVLKQYQLDRLGAFLDPNSKTERAAYNLNQSKIAIGSGGLTGKGLFLGSQTNLRYVPEQHTDFIFTVVGEELGLLGSATLLALFGLLMWRIWQAMKTALDDFGAFICAGVLGMLVFQIFENVGMTMGIMPITGIPLPLVSYGGSSMIATFAAIGLVLNVRYRSS